MMRSSLVAFRFVALNAAAVALATLYLSCPPALAAWFRARRSKLRITLMQCLLGVPAPTYHIASTNHRKWLQPLLECCGWRAGASSGAAFVWQLTKKMLPKSSAPVFNGLPNLLMLDDKAVLALLTRRFTRTRPLTTHVLYGEWDDSRVAALRKRWADPKCVEPRWWIIKDAHASNGFSTSLFDRKARPLVKKDVAGGYCYVVQEYVERPMLIDGRKFEMRQYVLICGDGSAYTYDGALIRLACVPYHIDSKDPRVHITNKWVQTGWEARSKEGRTLDDIERMAHDWPPYKQLLTEQIMPLAADLADAAAPLVSSGFKASGGATGRSSHFELFACDLVVSDSGCVYLMEVNINCAFGTFHPRTKARLIEPLFTDLVSLCVLPATGDVAPVAGRWRNVRHAGFDDSAPEVANKELQEHQMYLAYKRSAKKKYERQFVAKEFVISDVTREESLKE